MQKTLKTFFIIMISLVLLFACGAPEITSNDEIAAMYFKHKADFEGAASGLAAETTSYVSMNYEDDNKVSVEYGKKGDKPLSEPTLSRCKYLFRELHLEQINYSGGEARFFVFTLTNPKETVSKDLIFEKGRFKSLQPSSDGGKDKTFPLNSDWAIDVRYTPESKGH